MMILDAGTSTHVTLEEGEVQGEKCEKQEEEEEVVETWKSNIDKIHAKYERPFLDGCVYRGEGNANVVLALPSDRRVVRLRKSLPGSPASPDGGRARIIREIEFFEYVISSFLGEYVQPPEPLRVNREDMIKVSEAIRSLRPEHRLRKEIIEDYATVFMDYAFLPLKMTLPLRNRPKRPTFCIEIKPKQGFRHEMDEGLKKCTYCLTQYYKLKNGAVRSRSGYCPHDLFSGDNERMKKSLRGLLESPQNNFKIFKDGVVVYDSNSQHPHGSESILAEWFSTIGPQTAEQNFDNFFKLASTALLREFSHPISNIRRPQSHSLGSSPTDLQPQHRIDPEIVCRAKKILRFTKDECNFATNNIPQGSVLGRILNMQQLPYLNADLVFKVYSKHSTTLNDNAIYSQMIKTYRKENEAAVNTEMKMDSKAALKSIISDNNYNESNGTAEDMRNNNNNKNAETGERTVERKGSITIEELEILQNYLLATTAKDCSILMAFQEIDPRDVAEIPVEFIIEITEGVNFMVNIGVLDLDPKSINCIEKHRQRDTDVLLSLNNAFEEKFDFVN